MKKESARASSLAELSNRLKGKSGKEYWRSLEELADTEEFRELLGREFPRHASAWSEAVDRRDFLKWMGASLALAGLGACARPSRTDEKIVPYVNQPEDIVPGRPLFFATAFSMAGAATGLLVESHEGRPTKVEGNPEHPASLGATDLFAQASILTLYDPDRSQVVSHAGRISTWSAFYAAANTEIEAQRLKRGAGLRLLTEAISSPALARQLRALRARFPESKWHQYEPVGRDNVREGARLAFGEPLNPVYRLEKADVILSLDADLFGSVAGGVRYARDFAARRRATEAQAGMNRLYVVEAVPSVTGGAADHRLPLRAGRIESLAWALARRVGVPVEAAVDERAVAAHAKWLDALARDLKRHEGRSVVAAGETQPPAVHALAHAMNHALGNAGQTVIYTDPIEADAADQTGSLTELAEAMEAGRVEILIVLGCNPVYAAPVDLRFAERMGKVPLRIRLGLYEDETSALCHWHVPETHYLEAWGDARAYDGTVSIVQPLIAPLYEGKSACELFAALMGEPGRSGYEIVRDAWKEQYRGADFEGFWRRSLHDGVIAGSAPPAKSVKLKPASEFAAAASTRAEENGGTKTEAAEQKPEQRDLKSGARDSLEIAFRPDPAVFDGRFANNGWLQELPKPLTKLTWDNAALMSPATAARLGVANEDLVELSFRGRTLSAPVWILPGQAEDTVAVHLGYGRTRAGRVGNHTGFDAYRLRRTDALWHGSGLSVRKLGRRYPLACAQLHHNIEGRHLIRAATLAEYRERPEFARENGHEPKENESLYPEHPYEGNAWGMAIDLNACIGCNACVVACQAENNIPIVGKQEVARGREMHWIRIDRYYRGDLECPETYHQPVLCMHCENAPCEIVCPVAATVHSSEGLNDMVYNRCVGTRYCSNNCPYKVRRFNFFQYSDFETPSLKLMRNPDVTVRSRGVMEKCTYCVQRINAAKIDAEKEDRELRDGDIVTACQAACPTQAIVFGNVNDPKSRVAGLKATPLNYGLLAELNTRPRTTYLAKLKNPNPEIEPE